MPQRPHARSFMIQLSRTANQLTICITNTLGDDAVRRGIVNKFEPAPSEEPAEHIIIVAMLIAQLLTGTPGLQDSDSHLVSSSHLKYTVETTIIPFARRPHFF